MTIKNVFDDIAALIPTIPTRYGQKWVLNNTDVLPRVVAVPDGGTISEAVGPGRNPRPFATRNAIISWHCWGADEAEAEATMRSLCLAIYQNYGGSFRFVDESWPQLETQWLNYGALCIVKVEFDIPMVDDGSTAVTILSVVEHMDVEDP